MSLRERQVVTRSLPAHIDALPPPDGEPRSRAKWQAFGSLDSYLRQSRKGVYVGVDLAVYYPAKPVFAPDLLVVLNAKPGVRRRWDVNHEGPGLDFVLEIHHHGARGEGIREVRLKLERERDAALKEMEREVRAKKAEQRRREVEQRRRATAERLLELTKRQLAETRAEIQRLRSKGRKWSVSRPSDRFIRLGTRTPGLGSETP